MKSCPEIGAEAATMTSPDPSRTIASLARDQVNLDLKTVDLCFLAGLYLRADKAALASFEEDMLVDTFEQVCDVVEPGADNPRKRATHAIQRLREQRMLARVDGAGIVRAGEYALTRLSSSISSLTRHSRVRALLYSRARSARNSQRCWRLPRRWTANTWPGLTFAYCIHKIPPCKRRSSHFVPGSFTFATFSTDDARRERHLLFSAG